MNTVEPLDRTPSLTWTRSSYSSNEGGACVEVAAAGQAIFVRDSKDVARPGLVVDPDGWTRFVGFAARG